MGLLVYIPEMLGRHMGVGLGRDQIRWPSISWTVRRSHPRFSRCVANE